MNLSYHKLSNLIRLASAFIFKRGTVYVHYGITHRCNLSCKMCSIVKNCKEESELSLEDIDKLFEVLRKSGVIYVSIGGGEPLLREDIVDIAERLVKKGLILRLLTNGMLITQDKARRLSAVGLKDFSVSLDSLNPQRQDEICNYAGAWRKIVEALGILSENITASGRRLLINTVVSSLNINELPDLSRFAQKNGYFISFVPLEENISSDLAFKFNDHKRIDESYDALLKLKNNRKSNIFNSTDFLERSRRYLKGQNEHWQCDAGSLYFSVNPQGKSSICHKFRFEMPGLDKRSPAFFSPNDFKVARKRLVNECPGCMRPCWREISSLFRNSRSLLEMFRLLANG